MLHWLSCRWSFLGRNCSCRHISKSTSVCTGSFICFYITWKRWNFIHKFPPIKIQLNIWIMSLHKNSKKWQNKQNGATSWMLKAIKKWIWMLFWVESLKFMMLPTCKSKFFFKFQKFAFFEFPNHNHYSNALCWWV